MAKVNSYMQMEISILASIETIKLMVKEFTSIKMEGTKVVG
jgi:hypothetical protein